MRALLFLALTAGCSAPGTPQNTNEMAASAEVPVTPAEQPVPDDGKSTEPKRGSLHFGAPFTLSDTIPAHTALSNPEEYTNKTVRLSGTITDVCQKKGCWMVIEDSGHHMRVLMKDHSFAVAMDSSGKSCDVEGVIIAKQEDPKETEHYASESTPGTVIPEKTADSDTVYQFHATGVLLTQQM